MSSVRAGSGCVTAGPYPYFRAHGSMVERLVPEFCVRDNSMGCCFGYEGTQHRGDKEGDREKEKRTKKQMKTNTRKEEIKKKRNNKIKAESKGRKHSNTT